jgi:glutaryl-CoA dehydrogenase
MTTTDELGRAWSTDYFFIAEQLTAAELDYLLRARQFIDHDVLPVLAKLNNTVQAREVCASAREILGGNGILLEYHVARHMADMEALYTYEGTAQIQTLIVGRDITGVGAFA